MPPRPLRPKDEPNATEGSDSAIEKKLNKRRAVSSACIPCRKRKSKCDGALPACSTCIAVYRTECSYDADSDHRRKGALKRDIQSLQQQNDALDVIVASLRSLPEAESLSLLHNLRNDADAEALASTLRNNVKLPPSFAPQTLEGDFAHQMSSSSSVSGKGSMRASRKSSVDESQEFSDSTTATETPEMWFRAPQDAEFVDHLLNLYFSWVHPFYHFVSRDHFLNDMGRGRLDFCSAMLVNAIMAVACHYSDRSLARADSGDPNTAGDDFFAEAKRLLDRIKKPSLTTVQALGIMSVREQSHGRDSSAYQYAGRSVRMALELGLHLSVTGSGLRSAEFEVRKLTYWAVFNLETLCSVGVGRLSQLPRGATDISKPAILDRTENQIWRPFVDTNLPVSPSAEQLAHPKLFTIQLSRLCELASDMVNNFYAPQERFTSGRLATAYAQYQEWYRNLPETFHLQNTALPHVLVLHMIYHSCLLHLFRPYIKLDLSGANLYPRDTCTYCANEISGLMNALRAMYGLRRVCVPVPSLLLTASTIHLLNLPAEPSVSHFSQGLQDLQAMSFNHPFAARCVEIIRALSVKWTIAIPESAAVAPAFRLAGQRPWPSPASSTFWAASIPRKQSSGSGGGTRSGGSASSSQHESPFPPPANQVQQQSSFPTPFHDSTSLLDPDQIQDQSAFWTPFPAQTMPIPSQGIVPSMSLDFAMDVNAAQQWQVYGGTPSDPNQNTQHQQTPGMDYGGWGWQ